MHIAPTGEIDVLGLTPVAAGPGTRGPGGVGTPTGPPVLSPFGPLSAPQASVAKFFTASNPAAQQGTPGGGINITPSVNLPLFDLNIHVKNSSPTGNGNTDATFQFWNIWHVRETPGSTFITLHPSDYVLVHPFFQNQSQLLVAGQSYYQFPSSHPVALTATYAHWLHIEETGNFHLFGIPGQYVATFLNTAYLHVEHVPEPAGIALLSVGMVCTVVGAVMRRRRRKLVA